MVQQGHYGELSSILGAIPAQQALAAPEGAEATDEPAEREPVQRLRAGAEEQEEEGEEGEEDEEEQEGGSEGDEEEEEEEEEEEAAKEQPEAEQQQQQQQHGKAPRPHRLQTFVFSATLTLPASLRRRLRKGGGGASGSSDLDALMDKIPFRWALLSSALSAPFCQLSVLVVFPKGGWREGAFRAGPG